MVRVKIVYHTLTHSEIQPPLCSAPEMSLITEVNQHIYLAISVLSLPLKLI